MAYTYQGLYAWNWDGPLLAKCMTGLFTGLICVVLGHTQTGAARELRKMSPTELSQRLCAVKLFSCFLILFGLLLFGISLYLISVLVRWFDTPRRVRRLRAGTRDGRRGPQRRPGTAGRGYRVPGPARPISHAGFID